MSVSSSRNALNQPIASRTQEKKLPDDGDDPEVESRRASSFTIDAILGSFQTNKRKKRKACRGPRIPFTGMQVQRLEEKFRESNYLSSDEVMQLAMLLNLSETRIKIWFQNRRARLKKATAAACHSPSEAAVSLKEKRWLCES